MHNRSQFGPHYFRRVLHDCSHYEPQSFQISPELEASLREYMRQETEQAVKRRILKHYARIVLQCVATLGLIALAFAAAIYLVIS